MRAGRSAKSATRVSGSSRPERTGAARPAGPGGPAGPRSPRGPAGPGSPAGPATPAGPRSPAGPAGPRSPAGPAGPAGPRSPAGPGSPRWPGSPRSPAGPGSPDAPGSPRSPRAPRGPRPPAAVPGSPATGCVVAVRARVVPVRRVPVVVLRAGRRAAPLVAASPDGVAPFVSGSTRGGVSGRGSVIGAPRVCGPTWTAQVSPVRSAEPTPAATWGSRGGSQKATTTAAFHVSPGHPKGYCCACRFSGCTAHTNRSIPARSSAPSSRRRRRGSTR